MPVWDCTLTSAGSQSINWNSASHTDLRGSNATADRTQCRSRRPVQRGEQAQNPQAVVPTLYDGNARLFQSLAILGYLEDKYPNPTILPKDRLTRAWVRFSVINPADSHPLIVPRIRNYLTNMPKSIKPGTPLDPALARRRAAGDGGPAGGEEPDR
jgi:hypothetical protein